MIVTVELIFQWGGDESGAGPQHTPPQGPRPHQHDRCPTETGTLKCYAIL